MADAPEEWVGHFHIDDRVEFLKLNGPITVPGNVTLDLPNRRLFGLAVTTGADPDGVISCSASYADEQWTFSGTLDEHRFVGRATAGTASGQVELRRVALWDIPAYRALSAQYGLTDGRRISIHVNADDWVGTPVLFYSEHDRFVRIYPDTSKTMLSESLELFSLAPDDAGIHDVRSLVPGGAAAQKVQRLESWTEEAVSIDGPGGKLSGTLMTPLGPGPHPAIVMIHGAAGGRRDYYRAYAEHFVHAGMAALVYDRRGHGESTGDPGMSFLDKSYDAEAWVDHLQARPGIRPDRVGVWGFSNGSWVAPMVAARRRDIAFVAVIGASGTTAVQTEIHRRTFDLREQGVPEAQIDQVAELWGLVYDLLLSRRPDPAAAARFDELSAQVRSSAELAAITVQLYAIQVPFLGPVPPYPTYQDLVDELPNHPTDSDEWTCDPVDSYRDITVPVLYLVGDHDSNLPALFSAKRVGKTLYDAGNHAATVLLFPNTGHGMNVVELGSEVGMTSEEAGYRHHHFQFAGGFVDIVQAWAAARVAT